MNITEKRRQRVLHKIDEQEESLEWKYTIGRKFKGGVVKIIRKWVWK